MTDEIKKLVEKIYEEYSIYIGNGCYYGDSIYAEEAQEILKDALMKLAENILKVNK